MIVSMPKIAVNAPSTTALVSGTAPSGKFADALRSATRVLPGKTAGSTEVDDTVTSPKINLTGKTDSKSGSKSSKADVVSSKPDPQIVTVPQDPKTNLSAPPVSPMTILTPATPESDTDSTSDDEAQPLAASADIAAPSLTSTTFTTVPFFAMQMSTAAMMSTPTGQSCESTPADASTANDPAGPAETTDEKSPSTASRHVQKPKPVDQIASTAASAAAAVTADITESSPAPDPKLILRDGDKATKLSDKHASSGSAAVQPRAVDTTAKDVSVVTPFPAVEAVKSTTEVLPLTTTGRNVASKSDSGIVPPSSQSLKKDGDAAKNPPPSDKINPALAMRPMTESVSTVSSSSTVATNDVAPTTMIAAADSKSASPATAAKLTDAGPSTPVSTAMAKADASAEPAPHTSPLQVARLIERAGQAELRVGIQAGEFGNVGIRTSMSHSQFSAEISVERGELGRVLSAELPALHDRLAEQRVPVSNIVLQDHSAGSSSDLRQGARQNQHSQQGSPFSAEDPDVSIPSFAPDNASNENGLDLHV